MEPKVEELKQNMPEGGVNTQAVPSERWLRRGVRYLFFLAYSFFAIFVVVMTVPTGGINTWLAFIIVVIFPFLLNYLYKKKLKTEKASQPGKTRRILEFIAMFFLVYMFMNLIMLIFF